jgi:hypothetical protein
MLGQSRLIWVTRVAARDARAQIGSPWAALVAGALIAFIPTAVLRGFDWEYGLEAALLGAVVAYAITFLRVVIAKAIEYWRYGHPHFQTGSTSKGEA